MSYIRDINENEQQMKLRKKQDKLLADICKIVGSKKFTFSDAYINKVHPRVGVGEMSYSTITRKYVYVSGFLQYNNNEDCTEWGALIKKYPVYYTNKCGGKFVNKVPLTDLFTSDLEKILEDIKSYCR